MTMSFAPPITSDVIGAVLSLFIWLAVNCGFASLIHHLLTLPMRRTERGLLFLDLVETAVKQGQRVEEVLVSISQSRDRTLGARFHLLAAWLEKGLCLSEALANVPRLLPPQIRAMLQAGQQIGDVSKVLPACRQLLKDAISQTRGAINYLVVLAFGLSPFAILISMFLAFRILRLFSEVVKTEGATSTLLGFLNQHLGWLIAAQACLFTVLLLAAFIYIGGPRTIRWFQFRRFAFVDWTAWRVPWKHRRMQRNFSAMLGVLLDSGVPEAEAVRLAADCTANEIFRHRAQRVIAALQRGTKLTESVQALDDSGEFRWRLTNATHAHGGFLLALAGWHESLDAKAFQQEQAAAHVVTSALVVANGALVALVAIAVFSALISMINVAVQW
jgi:type II secretory pathway component PulF